MAKYHEQIITHMIAKGFKLDRQFGQMENGFELSFQKSTYNIDFFTFYHDVVRKNGNETEMLWNSLWWGKRVLRRMGYPMTEFAYTGKTY
jgi:hypothetical protein